MFLKFFRNGSITLGYFTWSFLDVFELMDGYKSSYDMKYVDFSDKELKRYPKLSAHWYSHFLERGRSVVHEKSSSNMAQVVRKLGERHCGVEGGHLYLL